MSDEEGFINVYEFNNERKLGDTEKMIIKKEFELIELLLRKNKDYGDSLQNPVNIFSELDSVQGILARLDDKILRIQSVGLNEKTADTITDIRGYLVHLEIALEKRNKVEIKNEE